MTDSLAFSWRIRRAMLVNTRLSDDHNWVLSKYDCAKGKYKVDLPMRRLVVEGILKKVVMPKLIGASPKAMSLSSHFISLIPD